MGLAGYGLVKAGLGQNNWGKYLCSMQDFLRSRLKSVALLLLQHCWPKQAAWLSLDPDDEEGGFTCLMRQIEGLCGKKRGKR